MSSVRSMRMDKNQLHGPGEWDKYQKIGSIHCVSYVKTRRLGTFIV